MITKGSHVHTTLDSIVNLEYVIVEHFLLTASKKLLKNIAIVFSSTTRRNVFYLILLLYYRDIKSNY